MRWRISRDIIIITILFVLVLQSIPINISAVGPTVLVEAQFDEGEGTQYADVSPGQEQHSKVIFPGTVTAEVIGGSVQKIIVDLQASSEQGWATLVDPSKITLNSGETAEFTVEVTVPTGTSCFITDTITVTGKGVAFPGMFQDIIEPITGTVIVKQYCQFALASSKPVISSSPNSKVEFEVRIINEGNGQEVFFIEVENLDELDRDGFIVTLSMVRVEIGEHEDGKFQVVVQTPKDSKSIGKHFIDLKVTSEHDYEHQPPPSYFNLVVIVKDINYIYTTDFLIIMAIIIAAGVGSIILIYRRKKRLGVKRKNRS